MEHEFYLEKIHETFFGIIPLVNYPYHIDDSVLASLYIAREAFAPEALESKVPILFQIVLQMRRLEKIFDGGRHREAFNTLCHLVVLAEIAERSYSRYQIISAIEEYNSSNAERKYKRK